MHWTLARPTGSLPVNTITNHEIRPTTSATRLSTHITMKCGIARTHWKSGRQRPIVDSSRFAGSPSAGSPGGPMRIDLLRRRRSTRPSPVSVGRRRGRVADAHRRSASTARFDRRSRNRATIARRSPSSDSPRGDRSCLHGGAGGDGLVGVGDDDRRPGEVGAALPVGRRTRAAADQEHATVDGGADVAQCVEPVEQAAQHAVVGSQRQLLAGGGVGEARRTCPSRRAGWACARRRSRAPASPIARIVDRRQRQSPRSRRRRCPANAPPCR